jgi:hypothetical protein
VPHTADFKVADRGEFECRQHEAKPLLVSAVYKASLFGLLVFLSHREELIWRLAWCVRPASEVRFDELLSRSLVVFSTFIPPSASGIAAGATINFTTLFQHQIGSKHLPLLREIVAFPRNPRSVYLPSGANSAIASSTKTAATGEGGEPQAG